MLHFFVKRKKSFLPPEKPRGEIENYVVEHTIADPLICENGDKLIEIKTLCLPRYTIISAIDERIGFS